MKNAQNFVLDNAEISFTDYNEMVCADLNSVAARVKSYMEQAGNIFLPACETDDGLHAAFYQILCRHKSETVPFSEHIEEILNGYMKESPDELPSINATEFFAPAWIDFTHHKHVVVDDKFYTFAYIPSYGYSQRVYAGWMSLFINASEGVDVDIFLTKIPKIYRGTKWGVADNQRVPNPVTKNLLSLENLHRHFTRTYLIPATTLGVDLLHRTACLPFTLVERMKEQWFAEHGHYTVLRSNGYLEAYEEGTRVKTVLFPVLSFEELAYHAAKGERVHVICERGTGEGISRVLGPIVESMRDFDAKPILFHRYDEAGVRMDGENPLTHHGYLAAEQQG